MNHLKHTLQKIVPCLIAIFFSLPNRCHADNRNTIGKQELSQKMQCRWFFSFGYGRKTKDIETIKSLIEQAAQHGYNGMVLSSFGFDSITRWKEKDFAMLKEVLKCCEANRIELIPTGFSAGYGGGALGHDRNFTAALPATLFLTAKDGHIFSSGSANLLVNGDMEQHSNNKFKNVSFHDSPGKISFADSIAASGKSSIRFENYGDNTHGHGRISQKVKVQPGRTYRFSFKVKTEEMLPTSGFKAMILAGKSTVASLAPQVKTTQGWTEYHLDYINQSHSEVRIYAGIWKGKSGKFWLDDMKFFEYGDFSEIVRRKGTPLELKSLNREKVFEEGRDFKSIHWQRELNQIDIPVESSIKDGEKLSLSCYKSPSISHSWGKQRSLCMSNSKLYEYWQAQAEKLYEVYPYRKYLLAMDEIRNGGGCLSCKERGISMAEILGDCFTRQHAIFKKINPEIEVITWSDMLDPAHNENKNYYGVVGDYTGSWKYIPKDISIMCWYHKIRETSLPFFSQHGFRTYGAAYYDKTDLTGSSEWLKSLQKTPNAQGIMYTTWQKKYGLLNDFGDMVSEGEGTTK